MLRANTISKAFGSTQAVHQLNLHVEKGVIYGLLGPNGAGKSTAIRMLCGVLTPDSGDITIDGISLATHPREAKQRLGYVPEGAPLPAELLVHEYLNRVAHMYGLSGHRKKSAIALWIDRCEIEEVLNKTIGALSRGYRQRVALAAALLHEPALVVLDEPSTGLDPAQQGVFHSILKDVAENAAILYSSHHLAEVEATCSRVMVIHHGSILQTIELQDSQSSFNYIVEISSEKIARSMNGFEIEPLEGNWIRCMVTCQPEEFVQHVIEQGARIRLLKPVKHSLDKQYLNLIRSNEGLR